MPDDSISLGPPRYYRPIGVRRKNGWRAGGLRGDVGLCPDVGPISVDAESQRLKAELWKHKYGSDELLDAVEAAIDGGVPGGEIDAISAEKKGIDDAN